MLIFLENQLREACFPEIQETKKEKKLSARELRDTNFSWALKNLRGKCFLNKSIGETIVISRDGLGEWKTTTKSKDQALSIKILGQLLENAVYHNKKPHIPPDSNIKEVLYFRHDCKINGNMYTAVITVKVYKSENRHKYYHHFLDDFILDTKK